MINGSETVYFRTILKQYFTNKVECYCKIPHMNGNTYS